MTKATRWGVSALLILGGVALGGFAGCSDDEPASQPPVDQDTGVPDTGATDTGAPADTDTTDTATDTGAPDTPAFVADRAVSLVFASPDLGEKLLCLGAFQPTDNPPDKAEPLQALGPIGRPDPSAPTDPSKFTGLPYGAVVPVPLNSTAIAALEALQVVIYMVDTNPLTGGSTCQAEWKNVKDDASRWVKFAPKAIQKDESAVVIFRGCKNAATPTTLECGAPGTAANFEIVLEKLDTAIPSTFAGDGTGPKVGFQFLHASPYTHVGAPTPPTFQNIDVYLVPMVASDPGDAGTDADETAAPTLVPGTPVKIASDASFKSKAASAVGVALQGDPANALIVFTPKDAGAPTCFTPSAECANVGVPLKAFLANYAATGGGFVDGTNQFIALAGSVIPKTGSDPATAPIRVMFGKSAPIVAAP